ncbi:MAG: prephenate dehydrogenase/arogenate dehydrogenase family protein [Anaerolineaceae bacterium]|nr:prephenate dehydrogenase/arogenate dehydrogenase family protein [Anaerolineaceae bacterium]
MVEDTPADFLPLSSMRIAIVGLGLMGGSMAMALRGRCRTLIVLDNDPSVLAHARQLHLADVLGNATEGFLSQADGIILAVPVGGILNILDALPHLHPGNPVVMDIGSTKREIVERMENLPPRFDPLGAHPMCGKEQNSLRNAEADLYKGAVFALCRLGRTTVKARTLAEQIVHAAGGTGVWMDAAAHDRMVAATSHLPYLAATVLAFMTPVSSAVMAGPGFRSTTRVGETDPALMMDVLKSNRENILQVLGGYRRELEALESMLAQKDWKKIEEVLSAGCDRRQEIIKNAERNPQCC